MVINRALRFYPPDNVSVRSEFYMFRKGAAGKTESKGRKYIDESWSTGDLKDRKDWGIENSVFARSRGD